MQENGRMLDALGGEVGCQRLSVAFYAQVAADPDLRPLFPGKTLRCATEEFSAFLIEFLGGDESMAQDRWWLGLRESHARFRITEVQRTAWLRAMETAVRTSPLDETLQDALLPLFECGSSYILGGHGEGVDEPELAERWNSTRALERLVADLRDGHDAEVLQTYRAFASRPSVFLGILARMLQTGRSPLVEAVAQEIENDPELRFRKHAGRTLLHYAAAAGRAEIVALLLRVGADPNVLDEGSHPPLYRLANECSADTGPEIVRMLVAANAEVNHRGGATRATPLHMAARRGHIGVARALLEAGASLEVRDSKGCTPFERAKNCRKWEAVRMLQEHER